MPRHRGHGKRDVGPLISRIEIEKLFHAYSYDLNLTLTPNPESGRLMLLYGNNGSGKTTILNMLYHVLDPEPYGGHRSYVGGIPFKMFRIHLVDGVVVTASRSRVYDAGPYDLKINYPHKKGAQTYRWDPERRHPTPESADDRKYQKFCSALQDLGFSFHYLRDTRRVEGSISRPQPVIRRRILRRDEPVWIAEGVHAEHEAYSPDKFLNDSVEAAIRWFRQHALSGTNVGYTSVNTIYRDIIKGIVQTGGSKQKSQLTDSGELIQELENLKEKNSEFVRFGLTPELDVQDMVAHLKSAKPRDLPMLTTVLRSYLGGHAARLEALEELQNVMNSFVSLLGRFFSPKRLSVHMNKGLNITAKTGQELELGNLSSGEKQLLLLFCNAISCRQEGNTILMIDEPELSLNVSWQRELIAALLSCMSGTAFQLIIATHSVELISQYRNCVTVLDNVDEAASHE